MYRENNYRFCAVKFSVRGRDLGSTIQDAQKTIAKQLSLDKGMKVEWRGEFENQVRATNRLKQIIPVSIFLIYVLLFANFNNPLDPALVLINVPFALIGGIWALYITGTDFSISAGVGFIALLGICIQNGVILITVFKQNVNQKIPLPQAVREGIISPHPICNNDGTYGIARSFAGCCFFWYRIRNTKATRHSGYWRLNFRYFPYFVHFSAYSTMGLWKKIGL